MAFHVRRSPAFSLKEFYTSEGGKIVFSYIPKVRQYTLNYNLYSGWTPWTETSAVLM